MKTQYLARQIPVTSASANAAYTLITVNTTAPHLLNTGDFIKLNERLPNKYAVTVTSGTQFTYVPVDLVNSDGKYVPTILVYADGIVSGAQVTASVTCGSTSDVTKTFQATGITTSGAGAATIAIEVSNNNVNFIQVATINLVLNTTVVTDGLVVSAPWAYVRANVTSISGTGALIRVIMGSAS